MDMSKKPSFLRSKIASITGDFFLSILASVINTFARQIVVFPMLAARLTDADYGTVLTVIGLVNVLVALVGGTLNNIRLIRHSKYEEVGIQGDFLWLCTAGAVIGMVCCAVLSAVFRLSAATSAILGIYILINNFYQYATAYFRLNLDFKRNMIVNVVASVAYIAGCFLFATPQLWPMVFLLGEGAGLAYTALTTRFYKEGFSRTLLFRDTTKAYLELVFVNLISNLLMYADRMIIHPILGPESVSYYSTASFFGKSAGIVMTPIAGVLLGYFSQKNFTASKKLFSLVNGLSLACLVVFLGGCWLFAPWFTKLLYPTLYEQSAPYIFMANLGAVISIAGNMAQPMLLKGCSTKYLMAIQFIYGVVYLACSLLMLPIYGLSGFCVATIIANSVRLLLFYGLGLWKL